MRPLDAVDYKRLRMKRLYVRPRIVACALANVGEAILDAARMADRLHPYWTH